MSPPIPITWIAFAKHRRIAAGEPHEVAARVKAYALDHPDMALSVFDGETSEPVSIDLRGTLASVLKRVPAPASGASASDSPAPVADADDSRRGRGRPKLGVVPREVTLLPRHWDWLTAQPGGASVTLRKLVEQARRAGADADRRRKATEAAYRFMHAMAGDAAGFEEASRALFAGDLHTFEALTSAWPRDVRSHAQALARRALAPLPKEDDLGNA